MTEVDERASSSTRRHPVRRVALGSGALLLLAAAAGVLWERWAEPGSWEVTEQGTILTQRAAQGQFGVEVRFIVIGAVLCLAWGALAGIAGRELGWWLAPVFAVVAGLAAVVAWQVGVQVGPPDPATVDGVSVGDRFPDRLQVESVASFLIWPCAALGGLVLGLVVSAEHPRSQDLDVA